MIQEQYVSFETANLLKEKGFDEPTYGNYYIDGRFEESCKVNWNKHFKTPISAPTQAMAMQWLREVQNLHIWVEPNTSNENMFDAHVAKKYCYRVWAGVGYPTYEEACEEAIKYCLENLI